MSKFSDPHPDTAVYGGNFTFVGPVPSGFIHPSGDDAGEVINGWNIWTLTSAGQPADDSNNHYWIPGVPADYGL